MRRLLRRALFEPGAFLESGAATRRRTWLLFGVTTLACLAPVPAVIALLRSEDVPEDVIGSLPAFVYAAGEATVSVPGLYALLVGLTVAVPVIAVGFATPIFHGLSWPAAGDGSLRETAVVAVWGLLPQTIASACSVAVLYAVYAAGVWPIGISVTLPARVVLNQPDPSAGWLLVEAISGVSVLWTGYVWTYGLAAVRDVSPRRAAVAVAIPLLLSVLFTPPGSRVLNWFARAVVGVGCAC